MYVLLIEFFYKTILQVAMGQGQSELAIQLLRQCSYNGDWLILKNLHLVTAWLPALEKVRCDLTFPLLNYYFCRDLF